MHCAQGFNTLLYLRHREACITQDEARRSRGRHGLRHGPNSAARPRVDSTGAPAGKEPSAIWAPKRS